MSIMFFSPEEASDTVAEQWLIWLVFHEGQMLQLNPRPQPTWHAIELAMEMHRAQEYLKGAYKVLLSPAK